MKTKVCPCCDQPIRGMYCRGCRKIVLNPVEQDVHYYLNERHPEHETDCSFHGNSTSETRASEHAVSPYEVIAKKNEIRERIQKQKQETGSTAKTVLNGDVIRPKHVSKSKASVVGSIILLAILSNALPAVFKVLDHLGNVVTVGQTEPVAEAVSDEWWEKTDEEVKAAGAACTGYGHFGVTYEEALPAFLACVRDTGYIWSEEETYSYNEGIDDSISWFQTAYVYDIRTEDSYAGMIEFDTDTATGQIHGILIYTEEEEGFFEIVDIAVKVMEETGIVGEELPDGRGFYEAAMENGGKDQLEEGFRMMHGLEVSCFVPENVPEQDFYSMSIYAPGYYMDAE